jgi:hypothetical protein
MDIPEARYRLQKVLDTTRKGAEALLQAKRLGCEAAETYLPRVVEMIEEASAAGENSVDIRYQWPETLSDRQAMAFSDEYKSVFREALPPGFTIGGAVSRYKQSWGFEIEWK